jgi:CBS-domain-containing membrane protein
MKENLPLGPQNTPFFRLIAFFSRLQLSYLLRSMGNPRVLVVLFVFAAGTTAIGIITAVAYVTRLPLIFPPLAPSAFILFHTPMSVTASPRNVTFSHTMAVAAGLLSLHIVAMIWPEANLSEASVMNWFRVLVIAISMGLIGTLMVGLRCVHPPAAASALLAAMGYLATVGQVLGIIAAVVLLVLEAIFFNRLIGGLPYPLWQAKPKIARNYGELAGAPVTETTFWRQLAAKTFERR